MATGPSGSIGPGAGIPLTTEWLQAQKKALKKAGLTDATEESSDSATLSSAAKELSSTKDERMLKSMRESLADLDTESESFLQDATERLIDSVIDQEYGEHFKKKPGYSNLQEKLTKTVLDNPASREALADFFELLLLVEGEQPDEDEAPERDESGEDEDAQEDEAVPDQENDDEEHS